MKHDWYIQIDGRVCGPYSQQELSEKAKTGYLRGDTPVRREGAPWIEASRIAWPATSIPELAASTANTPRNPPESMRISPPVSGKSRLVTKALYVLCAVAAFLVGVAVNSRERTNAVGFAATIAEEARESEATEKPRAVPKEAPATPARSLVGRRAFVPGNSSEHADAPRPAGAITTQPPSAANTPMSPEELFLRVLPSVAWVGVVKQSGHDAIGSGFLVSPGVVATSFHVIQEALHAEVVFSDGSIYAVDGVLGVDRNADVALLTCKADRRSALELGSDDLPPIGTKVYAVGHPQELWNTFSDGLISGHPNLGSATMIQTTAAISQGSSGVPLLSSDGKVVGIVHATHRHGQNLNLAIPIRAVRRLLDRPQRMSLIVAATPSAVGR